jgi:hypothetical protein
MGLERNYKNFSESSKVIKLTLVFALLLNLSTIHEWLKQKEANAATTSFLKLTEALNEIGDQFYLNSLRKGIRAEFLPKNAMTVSPSLNPMVPELPDPSRRLAAIDPSPISEEDLDFTDLDFIPALIDEPSIEPTQVAGVPKGILIIGDSILKSGLQEHFERNLARRDQNITMHIKSKSGTGLSRPDVFDWVSYIDKTKDSFEKTVIFLGTNDAQNLLIGKKVIPFDTKEWRQEYSLRVRTLLQKACSKSKQVFWVSSLRMRSDAFDAKMRSLHEVARREIKSQSSCAQYISAFPWFTKKLKYTDTWITESKKTGKKTIKLRVADGIHMTYWGADLFSQKLIESIYE